MGNFTLRFSAPSLGLPPVTSGVIAVSAPPTFGPGPNFSAGLSAIPGVQDIRGNLLPGIGTANAQGQVAAFGQVDQLSTASSPSNPSGSAQKMRLKVPGSTQTVDCWLTWAPPDFGGRASSRYRETPSLVGLGLNWQELNIRRRFNVSAGWTNLMRSCTETTVQNFTATGSTPTQINAPAGTFTPDQFNPSLNGGVTHYIRAASGNVEKAYKIVGNSGGGIQIDPAFPGSGTNWIANGRAMRIFRAAATGASPAFNAGTKHFWPRLVVDCAAVNTTVHGQAVSLPARTNVADRENNYVTLTGEPGATAEGYSFQYRLQINDWDGVTTDGQGAVGVDGAVTFGAVQRLTSYGVGRQSVATYPFGVPMNVEYKLRLNTPGQADGLFQVFINESGTPLANATNVEALPRYVFTTVNVGGVNYTVPQPVTAARFDYVLKDPTLGGGLGIPDLDQWLEEEAVVFRGKNVPTPTAQPNPFLLPIAKPGSTGLPPNPVAGLASQPAGFQFTDLTSGVAMAKLTSTTVPNAGSHNTCYPSGGPWTSQPWVGGDGNIYYTVALDVGSWLCDFRADTMTAHNWRQAPYGGESAIAFSMQPGEEKIAYMSVGSQIRRFNTAVGVMAFQEAGTPFPWSPSGGLDSGGGWLQSQRGPWIACQSGAKAVNALNVLTGVTRNCTPARAGVTGSDEFHLDLTEPVVYLVGDGAAGNNLPWRLDTDVVTPSGSWSLASTDGARCGPSHTNPLRGGIFGVATEGDTGGNPYGGAYWFRLSTGQRIRHRLGFAQWTNANDHYQSGQQNLFAHQGNFDDQWICAVGLANSSASETIRGGLIVLHKVGDTTPGGVRYLCSTASSTGVTEYGLRTRMQATVDGKYVFFCTNHGSGTVGQVYAVRVPTS